MITVSSWDELLHFSADCVFEKSMAEELQLREGLVLTIRIRGESWGGFIDYRGANYVLELQKSFNRLYLELSGADIQEYNLSKAITVKVRVVEGSSLFEIKVGDALKYMISKLSGSQITLITVLAISCATGYFTTGKVLDYKRQMITQAQQGKIAAETIEKLTPVVNRALDIIKKTDMEKPMRVITTKLESDDSISLPDSTELSAQEAKHRYPKKQKSSREAALFDGTYRILSIDFKKAPPVFNLYKNDHEFRATAELAEQDIDKLAADLKQTLKTGKDFNVSLQLLVVYNSRRLIAASITGIGDKRDNSKDFLELVRIWEK